MSALTLHPPMAARARRLAPAALGVLLTLVVAGLGVWLAERPLVRGHGPDYQHPTKQAAGSAGLSAAGLPAITVGAAATALPGDDRHPAEFAVLVDDANTPAGAILRLSQLGTRAPAGTYAPLNDHQNGTYQVLAGAYQTFDEADALLATLRAHGELSQTSGTVVRVPLTFLIEQDAAASAAAARVAAYTARGLPAYALRQADGRVWVVAGAFAAASDTTPLANTLRAAGVHATLAYRTGRPF